MKILSKRSYDFKIRRLRKRTAMRKDYTILRKVLRLAFFRRRYKALAKIAKIAKDAKIKV